MAGKPINLVARAGGYALSGDDVQARFGTRAAIFAGFDGGRDWSPAP